MSSVVIAEFPTAKVIVEWNKDAPYSVAVDGEIKKRCHSRELAITWGSNRALMIMGSTGKDI